MNSLILQSILKTALSVGGTTLGVSAAYSGNTITIGLGALGPVISIVWSLLQHWNMTAVPKS